MPNKLKKKSNTLVQGVHDAYNHDVRKIICITTSLTALICKISLQFCCEFIDNNRSNISFVSDIAKLIKLPTSILYILHSGLNLAGYKSRNKEKADGKDEPEELVKVIGSLALLANTIITVLMQTKIIHFLAGSNRDIIGHIGLTSTILFLFISEPISYYYTLKKYQEAYKKCQDKKGTDEFTSCENELAKCKKELAISTLTLSLGLLSFILKRIETTTIPINLGNGIIYNFNLSVTVGIIYSAVFLVVQLDKLFNQPINDVDPSSELNHVHPYDNFPATPLNGCAF